MEKTVLDEKAVVNKNVDKAEKRYAEFYEKLWELQASLVELSSQEWLDDVAQYFTVDSARDLDRMLNAVQARFRAKVLIPLQRKEEAEIMLEASVRSAFLATMKVANETVAIATARNVAETLGVPKARVDEIIASAKNPTVPAKRKDSNGNGSNQQKFKVTVGQRCQTIRKNNLELSRVLAAEKIIDEASSARTKDIGIDITKINATTTFCHGGKTITIEPLAS